MGKKGARWKNEDERVGDQQCPPGGQHSPAHRYQWTERRALAEGMPAFSPGESRKSCS